MFSGIHEEDGYNLNLDLPTSLYELHVWYPRRSGPIGKVTIHDPSTLKNMQAFSKLI